MPVAGGTRVGLGYDVHPFAEGRRLVLGGVEIAHTRGLAGHSDADAVCHAVADALLGAVGLGDLGQHFPDTDPVWQGADSMELLRLVVVRLAGLAFEPFVAALAPRLPDVRIVPFSRDAVEPLAPKGLAFTDVHVGDSWLARITIVLSDGRAYERRFSTAGTCSSNHRASLASQGSGGWFSTAISSTRPAGSRPRPCVSCRDRPSVSARR